MPTPKNKHAKLLKSQFGLTEAQAQAVETDIVDDKTIVRVEVKDEDPEIGIIGEDIDEEGKILSTSYTRSGRLFYSNGGELISWQPVKADNNYPGYKILSNNYKLTDFQKTESNT